MKTNSTDAFQHMIALTDLGPRVAGTSVEAKAAAMLAESFASFGLLSEKRAFPTRFWLEKDVALTTDGIAESFEVTSVPFGGALPPGRHSFELVYVEQGAPFDLKKQDIKNKALLLSRDAYVHYPDTLLVERLAPYEPALLIFTASPGHKGVPTVFYNFRDVEKLSPPPCFVISHDVARRILGSNQPLVHASLDAVAEPRTSQNVLGILPGTDLADEIVVVCAHYDSAPTSPGASDNAGGSACVLELARAATAAGGFRRTVHFALWGSHETGMHGSEAYIREARRNRDKVVAAINFDSIGQTVGEDRLAILGGAAFTAWADGLPETRSIAPSLNRGPGYTDYTNFGAAGIPALSIAQSYLSFNHTPHDSIDRCSPRALDKPLALGAAFLRSLASQPASYLDEFPTELAATVGRFNSRWGWSNFDSDGQPTA